MTEIRHQINASIQIVPICNQPGRHVYELIDSAINIITESGLSYQVTPMETVVEGTYDEVMDVFKKAQERCLSEGADELVVQLRIHINAHHDVEFQQKTGNYDL